MRKFDHNGLLLAEYQAKLFEQSLTYFECSTKIFLRRFYYSRLLKKLDENESGLLTLCVNDGFDMIKDQFGETTYGKEKWNKEVLFWMGYMYRYISYTRDINTRYIMDVLFPVTMMKEVYYVFHTQSEEWVISSLLELINKDENIFDCNYRLKEYLREHSKHNSY